MHSLRIENLSKSYGKTRVLNDIHMTIDSGSLVSLLGPSGCGKSTLLRIIAGLIEGDHGRILFGEEDVTCLSAEQRGIGMVFQNYALFPNLNVFENIAFGLRIKGMDDVDVKRKVYDLIEQVELVGKENAMPHQLSGGQKQRVALARALVMEPRVLLLDEPLSALDAKIRKQLRLQIREIQKRMKITTIFVTHDQEEALTMSDGIFVMNNGMIVQRGSAEEIYSSPSDPFVAGFIGHYNLLDGDRFALRPEVIRLIPAESEIRWAHDDHFNIPGKVTDAILLGNTIRYLVETGGEVVEPIVHHSLAPHIMTVDVLNDADGFRYKVGEDVVMGFHRTQLHAIK